MASRDLGAPRRCSALAPQLAACPVPLFSILSDGLPGREQPGFEAVLSLVKLGRAYIEVLRTISALQEGPDYGDLVPVVRAFLAANPDRLLWGSGWPHVD